MRKTNSVAIVALSVVLFTPVGAQQASRTIPYAPNRTIAERLLPNDQVVQVHREYDYPVFKGEPSARAILQGLLEGMYGTAVLVDVAVVRGILVDDERWIRTLFEGTVVEVLSKAPTSGSRRVPLVKGDTVNFSSDGGQLKIGQVLVKTTGNLAFDAKRRYLAFLSPLSSEFDHLTVGADPILIEGQNLVSVPRSDTNLAGLTLADVRALARKVEK
jgi:hypothetical protein